MFKKLLCLGFSVFMALCVLCGCGGKDSGKVDGTDNGSDVDQNNPEDNADWMDDWVKPEWEDSVPKGKFYSLEIAYENGYVTQEDLLRIADLQNNLSSQENPNVLEESVERSIRATAAQDLRQNEPEKYPKANASGFFVLHYYGEYNGSYAVMMRTNYWGYPAVVTDLWVEVGGVKIHYTGYEYIEIWREN